MSELQEWCKKILPVVRAAANGEEIEILDVANGEWIAKLTRGFIGDASYRIKPRTIKIGDIEVPEPMREAPEVGCYVFSPMPATPCMTWSWPWCGSKADIESLRRGMLHLDDQSAIAHAEALIALTAKSKTIPFKVCGGVVEFSLELAEVDDQQDKK